MNVTRWIGIAVVGALLGGAVLAAGMTPEDKAFVDKMAGQPGAQKLASGVVYIEEKAGTGAQPTATSKVTVNYRGTLVNGKEFDSSYKRNKPLSFPLDGVIRCWTEGVQKMKVGGKAKLICPPDTAYGSAQAGEIPPNSTLVFEVELLDVK